MLLNGQVFQNFAAETFKELWERDLSDFSNYLTTKTPSLQIAEDPKVF